MSRLPLHLDLTGRRVLVVGAGRLAVRRVRSLLAAGAVVEVVAPDVSAELPDVPVLRRGFVDADVDGAWLVLACTGVVDDVVAAVCEQRGIWCVRGDDAEQSRAWMPAVARVDDVVVSVTAGGDPRRAVALRDALALAMEVGDLPLRRGRAGAGSVALVGGGPGDPGLLTVRARRLLAGADVVVRDRLAPAVTLPAEVEVIEVGKTPGGPSYDQRAIEQLLVDRARSGQRVVRLKGGDVHVFGRGMEEVTACVEAGVAVEVVPGVSSAFAVPAAAGIPVTARGVTQSVSVVSAHLPPGDPGSTVDWDALARLGGTVVLLMAVGRLESVCAALVAGGRDAATPVGVVQDGTLPSQRVIVTTLRDAARDSADVKSPAVVVIGDVVGLR
ncbi:MAG: cysG [Frankiales bacterium]|nr:cysG [Frankiales bacterium]